MGLWGRARAQTGSSGTVPVLLGAFGSDEASILARPLAGVIRLGPKPEALPRARARVAVGEPLGTGPEVTQDSNGFLPSLPGHW